MARAPASAPIRVGIGGWTYEPWRDNFYPAGLPHKAELAHASRQVTAIEINSTYYGTQKPSTFAKWRDDTPDSFVFSVKALRYATGRKLLAEAGESVERFIGSGLAELGPKLGPVVWQFPPFKRFDADDFAAFLALLPKTVDGLPLRHAAEVRHPSFRCAEYLALARRFGVATVFTDSDQHPSFADPTGPFIYARLMKADANEPTGYAAQALAGWADCGRRWFDGQEPADLPRVEPAASGPTPAGTPRDVFIYFINGAKERAPAAAMALLERLG